MSTPVNEIVVGYSQEFITTMVRTAPYSRELDALLMAGKHHEVLLHLMTLRSGADQALIDAQRMSDTVAIVPHGGLMKASLATASHAAGLHSRKVDEAICLWMECNVSLLLARCEPVDAHSGS